MLARMLNELFVLCLTLAVALLAGSIVDYLIHRQNRNLVRVLERERNFFAQERLQLLDRIMHMSGNTWNPPPRLDAEPDAEEKEEPEEPGWHAY
jgi:hypothetical protein